MVSRVFQGYPILDNSGKALKISENHGKPIFYAVFSLYNAGSTNMGVANTGQPSLKKDYVDAPGPRYLPGLSERSAHSDLSLPVAQSSGLYNVR